MNNNFLKSLQKIRRREAPPEHDCSELERLIYGYKSAEREVKLFRGLKVSWQTIRLPEDFDSLITFVAPALREFDTISLCFSDIVYQCALDVDHKICKSGHLKIFEVSYLGSVEPLAETFCSMYIKGCCLGCIAILKGDYTMDDVIYIEEKLQDALGENSGDIMVALQYDRTIPRYFTMQVIFRIVDYSLTGWHFYDSGCDR